MRRAATDNWRADAIELFLLEPEYVSAAYVGWLNDKRVNRFLESRFSVATLESTRQFVASALASDITLFLGIRVNGQHVGNIKLAPIDLHHGLGEIGIMIGEVSAWGQGVGSNAIGLMARIAKQELGLRKITAGCYASNTGSVRAFTRAGFVVEGVRPAHFLCDGRPEDLILLARPLRAC